MNLFTLMATLGIDDTKYREGLAQAERSAGKFGGAIGKVSNVIKSAAIPLAVGAIGKSAIETGMDFESSMSQVASTMGLTAEQIKAGDESFRKMSEAAKEAGATTKFTAKESADALNYLALAGYDADKAVAALPTVLNLASAGNMDLAYASDLVTDSMSALGLESQQMAGFTDQLTKTSQRSNTSISQLGEAILTVGGTAKVLSGDTVELTTQLGILADNGIKGAEGGTALRNVILSLSAPTDKAAKLMKELGLEAFDANGKLRPTNEIFKDLNGILGKMTQEEQTKVLSELFNKVDLKSVNALLANSGERFNELSQEISNATGATAEAAKVQNDNVQGALTTLGSAFDGLKVQIFEKFSGPLKEAILSIGTGIGKVTEALQSGQLDGLLAAIGAALAGILTYITLIKGVAIVSGIIAVIKPLMTALTMVKSLSGAMAILNSVMLANPVGLVIAGLAALVAAFVYLWNTCEGFRQFWQSAWEAIKGVFSGAVELIKVGWQNLMNFPEYCSQKMEEFKQSWQEKWQAIKDWFSSIWLWIQSQWQNMMNWIGNLGNKIAEFKNNWVNKWNEIKSNVANVVSNIVTFFAELPGKLWNIFREVISKAAQWVRDMATKGREAASELVRTVMDGLAGLPGKVLSLATKIPQMIWQGITSGASWLKNKVSGFIDTILGKNSLQLSLQPMGTGAGGAMNAYNMASNGLARAGMNANFSNFTNNMNVSLNISGREFDKLIIKTVANNYGKIESIVQQKERGRR